MTELDQLCIRGTNVLLLELPFDAWHSNVFYSVQALCKRFTVVLAHIDRYVRHQKADIQVLLDMGALAQVNGSAFASYFTRRKMNSFWQDERVVAFGSDLHGVNLKNYELFCNIPNRLGSTFDTIMERSRELLQNAEYLQR